MVYMFEHSEVQSGQRAVRALSNRTFWLAESLGQSRREALPKSRLQGIGD